MLQLLVEEGIGCPNSFNKMGMLPMDIEHNTVYEQVPTEISHYFQELLRESLEGDYLIVTS